jgi:GntR family transcriptional regulator
MIKSSGKTATVRLLCQEVRPASRREADALQLRANTEVLAFERLFLADETPVFYSINVLPTSIIIKPYPPEAAKLPIFTFLQEYCHQETASALADISATSGDARVCEVFGIDLHKPVLRFDEIFMTRNGFPLVCATNHYNDQVLRLRLVG